MRYLIEGLREVDKYYVYWLLLFHECCDEIDCFEEVRVARLPWDETMLLRRKQVVRIQVYHDRVADY